MERPPHLMLGFSLSFFLMCGPRPVPYRFILNSDLRAHTNFLDRHVGIESCILDLAFPLLTPPRSSHVFLLNRQQDHTGNLGNRSHPPVNIPSSPSISFPDGRKFFPKARTSFFFSMLEPLEVGKLLFPGLISLPVLNLFPDP